MSSEYFITCDIFKKCQRHSIAKKLGVNISVIESSTINFSEDQTKTEGDIYQGYCELF